MKVLKFGGSSIGSSERMLNVLNIAIAEEETKFVVLSAIGGTTNKLLELSSLIKEKRIKKALQLFHNFKKEYQNFIRGLFSTTESIRKARIEVEQYLETIKAMIYSPYLKGSEKLLVAQGELISTKLFYLLCLEKKINCALLPALEFMKIDEQLQPDEKYILEKVKTWLDVSNENRVYITQGYICMNYQNEVDNLGRGGSDYTATILGAVLQAEEIQIWTDIDGMHNNDPRYVKYTKSMSRLSFQQASQSAFFGSKVLHPSSVIPALLKSVPIRIKNTFRPEALGTLICENREAPKVVNLASVKENVVLISIYSDRSKSGGSHFLFKIFEVLKEEQIEASMVSTGYQSISLVMEERYIEKMDKLNAKLSLFSKRMEIEKDFCIIHVMSEFRLQSKSAINQILHYIRDIPIHMISQKTGKLSYMLLLVKVEYKGQVLRILNDNIVNVSRNRRMVGRIQ